MTRSQSRLIRSPIAQRLFLARRTVETHLTSVYRKLGIGGREGLASALDAGRGRRRGVAAGG
ncbi:MAG: LuxR C-terminal-related transcriptional regulator [Thermoleophilaceae bacterium]